MNMNRKWAFWACTDATAAEYDGAETFLHSCGKTCQCFDLCTVCEIPRDQASSSPSVPSHRSSGFASSCAVNIHHNNCVTNYYCYMKEVRWGPAMHPDSHRSYEWKKKIEDNIDFKKNLLRSHEEKVSGSESCWLMSSPSPPLGA